MKESNPTADAERPDPDQGHARQWPLTPYTQEIHKPEPAPDAACTIALLGDCTVACTYLPPANRPENHLAVRLRQVSKVPYSVKNFGCDGESAESFISSGRMEKCLLQLVRLDIAFIRYGINDRKTSGISGCIRNLKTLADYIRSRFPGSRIIFETGIWVDYPQHYLWDRNSRLQPLYAAIKEFSQVAGYACLDIFEKTKAETEAGNWDLRIRGMPGADGRYNVIDDSFDAFYGADPAYFTNIHPNSRCVSLIAQWQTQLLSDSKFDVIK